MVVKKEDIGRLGSGRSREKAKQARALEKKIDAFLRKEGGGIFYLTGPHVDADVRISTITKYREAGWTVTYESDDREPGEWLLFS